MTSQAYLGIFKKYSGKPSRIILGIYKDEYGKIFLSALFYLIKHSAAWVTPIALARIITLLTQGGDIWQEIVIWIFLIAVLVLINIPFNYLHVHFRSKALRKVERQLRSAITEKLQLLTISYHNKTQSGKLQSKMIRDVEAVQTLSEQIVQNFINIVINITVSLIITARSNFTIFIFFLLTVPVAAMTIRFFRKPIEQKNRAFRHQVEKTSAEFVEMENLIEVTRAHALEDLETKRLTTLAKQVADEGYRLDIIQANFGSISWAIFQFFQLATLLFSAYLTLQAKIPVGNLVLYQSYFTTIVNQVTALIALVPLLSKGLESVNSIAELLNASEVEDYTGKPALGPLDGNVKFDLVSFTYGEKPFIQDFSLDVAKGQTIALVGESGSGKTSLMNLLIGFIRPQSGTIWIDGKDMRDLDLRSFRSQIAVVPQDPILFTASIRENITYGMQEISDENLMEVLRACRLDEMVRRLPEGLDTVLTEGGSNLSGGQRQRMSIARALVRNPKLIILDEATSALDSISEKAVMESVETLIEGRTAFVIAHRISTIQNADVICVLEDGKIVEQGKYHELMAKAGAFATMQKLQQGEQDDSLME